MAKTSKSKGGIKPTKPATKGDVSPRGQF